MTELTQDRLRALLDYGPSTGHFQWKDLRGQRWAGLRAGNLDSAGHRQIMVDGRAYAAHRLVFLYVPGRWPHDQIDHANRERDDNRFVNLRDATLSQNMANRRALRGAAGRKGTSLDKRSGRWNAAIGSQRTGGRKHLGTFDTAEEAHAAYAKAAVERYGEFARMG